MKRLVYLNLLGILFMILCQVPNFLVLKTKAELQEIAKTEVEITKLEQKINDLGGKLDQSDENLSSMHDSCSEPQQTSDHTKL